MRMYKHVICKGVKFDELTKGAMVQIKKVSQIQVLKPTPLGGLIIG